MPIDWKSFCEEIANHQRFVLTSHVRPDADAIGSELGMVGILRRMGKEVRIINPGETPQHLHFLDPEQLAQSIATVGIESACDTDVHIVMDTSAWKQVGKVGDVLKKTKAKKIVIDHHVESDDLGAIVFRDESAPATGCLMCELSDFLKDTMTASEATAVYAAIATDTGWFRFPATTPGTLRHVADLMDSGAKPSDIYLRLYEQDTLPKVHLMGKGLSRVAVASDGKLAYTYITQEDFKTLKAHPADTEGLVNECLKIAGTEAAFIIVEQPNRQFKVSLRSRGLLDVSAVAGQFSGGGHRQASGAVTDGPLSTALEKILTAMSEMIASADSKP